MEHIRQIANGRLKALPMMPPSSAKLSRLESKVNVAMWESSSLPLDKSVIFCISIPLNKHMCNK